MFVMIRRQQVEVPPEAEATLLRRLQFALDRFAARVRRVVAFVGDVNGPRGGIDKRCRLVAALEGMGPVTVEARGSGFGALFAQAAYRLARAVRGQLDRRRDRRSRS